MKNCKPIIFTAEMVRAILDGRKTQTRRVITRLPDWVHAAGFHNVGGNQWAYRPGMGGNPLMYANCPYGQPGDQLWVRETWSHGCVDFGTDRNTIHYRAYGQDHEGHAWSPSIHMRREYSRITLKVTAVRVERVQDISEEDAMAEGVNGGCLECGKKAPCGCLNPSPDHRDSFIYLWDSINAKRGYSWESNPWVWVVGI